jgi:hypothetical protein
MAEAADVIVMQLLQSTPDWHIGVGPLVRRPNLFVDVPPVYFTIAASDVGGFFVVIAGAINYDDAAELRLAVQKRLLEGGAARYQVTAFQSERALARWCCRQWPCAKTRAILVQLEAERRPT